MRIFLAISCYSLSLLALAQESTIDSTADSTATEQPSKIVIAEVAGDDSIVDKDKANEWFNNEETFKDVYAKKTPEYLEIVAKNLSPVWDSELAKYVAEEEKEETETASLEEEINFLRDEKVTPSTNGSVDETVTVTNLDEEETDDLPF